MLPRQVLKGSTAAKIASVANELAASANSVNVGNVILNTVLSASLNQIWSMINTQQLIVLMPLFNVNIPPNAAVFFGILMSIASFDILPTDKFYAKYFPQNDSGAINDNFNAVGF